MAIRLFKSPRRKTREEFIPARTTCPYKPSTVITGCPILIPLWVPALISAALTKGPSISLTALAEIFFVGISVPISAFNICSNLANFMAIILARSFASRNWYSSCFRTIFSSKARLRSLNLEKKSSVARIGVDKALRTGAAV